MSVSGLRVAIVGGGITGLTTAYRLLQAGAGSVTLLEARSRLGGNIQTERRDGFVIDEGPDSFVTTKPEAKALCIELGLKERLLETTERNRKVYIARGGRMLALPEGLMLGIPTRFWPTLGSPVFSWRGKLRMAFDVLTPKGEAWADESIAHFIRRRLGREALERVAEPLLGGIYAGDVETLSLRATFPQLAAMEQKHGSLIQGAIAEKRARAASGLARANSGAAQGARKAAQPSPFLSLLGGMGELIEALSRDVIARGGHVQTGARVDAVRASSAAEARFEVAFTTSTGKQETLRADHVVMATPAFAAAGALASLDAELAARLRQIPYLSTAIVVFAFPRVDVPHALDAVGVVLPKAAENRLLAATFISSKWAGRAPDDMALLRVFIGGHRFPHALDASDDELVTLARAELEALVGVRARPSMSRVFRFERGSPQPLVGHIGRVMNMKQLATKTPGLYLVGAAFDGVGIPDCVRQANETAARILRSEG